MIRGEKTVVLVVLFFSMMVLIFSVSVQATNVTQTQIQDIKETLTDIKAQKKEVDTQLATIRSDLGKAQEKPAHCCLRSTIGRLRKKSKESAT